MSFDIDKKVEELHEVFEKVQYQHPILCVEINKIINDIVVNYKSLKEVNKILLESK